MLPRIAFLLCTVCALAAHADGGTCTIPEVTLENASPGEKIDLGPSRAVVSALIEVAERESAPHADPALLGTRVELVDGHAAVSADVLSLAIRLRQLECAIAVGRVSHPEALFAAFLFDARTLLAQLGGPPPTGTLPSVDAIRLALPSAPPPLSPAAQKVDDYHASGIILIVTGLTVGALAAGLGAASTQVGPCGDQFLCFNDAFRQGLVGGAIFDGAVGATLVITGAALLHKSSKWADRVHLAPTVAVGPGGGSAGLRFNF